MKDNEMGYLAEGEFIIGMEAGMGVLGYESKKGPEWLVGTHEDTLSDLFGSAAVKALRSRKILTVKFYIEE